MDGGIRWKNAEKGTYHLPRQVAAHSASDLPGGHGGEQTSMYGLGLGFGAAGPQCYLRRLALALASRRVERSGNCGRRNRSRPLIGPIQPFSFAQILERGHGQAADLLGRRFPQPIEHAGHVRFAFDAGHDDVARLRSGSSRTAVSDRDNPRTVVPLRFWSRASSASSSAAAPASLSRICGVSRMPWLSSQRDHEIVRRALRRLRSRRSAPAARAPRRRT